jgi:hypothetical protein
MTVQKRVKQKEEPPVLTFVDVERAPKLGKEEDTKRT